MTEPANDRTAQLTEKLLATVAFAQEIVHASARARRAIVALAQGLNAVIKSLPAEQVASLGVSVRVIMRGTPKVADVPGLQTEYLPSIDDGHFETRSGATSLYLDAMGSGSDAVRLEVRSIPGQIVLATCSLETMERWLEDVRGIEIDGAGSAHLVREHAPQVPGPDAVALFEAFLDALQIELRQRAHFNRVRAGSI